ncbi:MAG TPA: hypothetical protein VGN15_03040, partial [Ktedonobacteraceae bacterium]|nr:hypothetical protein [Ktedonobacteraceae bacterium]
RLNMWDDLMEKDPKMRELREKNKAEGEVKGLQQAVVVIVRGRFPELSALAEQRVTQVNEAPVLYYLVEKLSTAPDEAMARWILRPSAA